MVDNVVANPGVGGQSFATDFNAADGGSGAHWPITKVAWGTRDSNYNIVDAATGLPVQPGSGTTWAISAASLPLPTGAAVASKQPALGAAVIAASTPVNIASDQTVPVSGTFFQATQPVSGSVSVSNFPATQPVSGTVTANAGTNLNTSLLALEAGGNLATMVTSLATIDTDIKATQPRSITNFPATQAVSGTVTANQGTANTTPWNQNLSQVGGVAVALGQAVSSASLPVVLASDQTLTIRPSPDATVAISNDATSPVPIIGQVQATLAGAVRGIPIDTGQTTMANALPVVIASDQTTLPVYGSVAQAGQWLMQLLLSGAAPSFSNPLPVQLSDGTSSNDIRPLLNAALAQLAELRVQTQIHAQQAGLFIPVADPLPFLGA